jgi:acyl carrier protein
LPQLNHDCGEGKQEAGVTSETHKQPLSRQQIVDWLISWIAKELAMPAQDIDAKRSLLEYSMSSLTATILVGDLEDWLALRLPPSLVWDYPSIDAIADHLVEKVKDQSAATRGKETASDAVASGEWNVHRLLDGLDQLSDQDVDALLKQFAGSERAGA